MAGLADLVQGFECNRIAPGGLGGHVAFERQPEKLSAALDTYFRLQGLERELTSLADGVRKYQNPAVGDLLLAVMGENTANREGLRQYIGDLAVQREQEFAVADREAQRCRATINRQPAPAPPKRSKQ